jgi:hypothetical protein
MNVDVAIAGMSNKPSKIPRAAPQPWHAESCKAWDEHYVRCQVGRAERRKIRERWEARMKDTLKGK